MDRSVLKFNFMKGPEEVIMRPWDDLKHNLKKKAIYQISEHEFDEVNEQLAKISSIDVEIISPTIENQWSKKSCNNYYDKNIMLWR